MADTPIPVDTATATFDALTLDLRPRVMVDNIFQDKPVWKKFRANMKGVYGRAWMPPVQLAKMSGQWYTRASPIGSNLQQQFSPEIATSASYRIKKYAGHVLIPAEDVDEQGNMSLVDLLRSYTENEVLSVRDDLSTALFERDETTIGTGQVTNGMESLDMACYYGNTYGGIDPTDTDQETWEAHVMYGATDGGVILPVSPSWGNFEHLVDEIVDTTGERPSLGIVTPPTWRALKGQISAEEYASMRAAYANTDVVKWGFSALWVQDVPLIKDRDCYAEDFAAGQATTVLAKGHDAYFPNFNHLKLAYNKKRSFKWHEDGWKHTMLDYDAYLNMFYAWCTIGTDARRTLGRVINIDPTQGISDFTPGTVRLPGADA